MMTAYRTSQNSPLRIGEVSVNDHGGAIGMTLCPGKRGPSVYGADWARDIDADLLAIKDWGAVSLVSLMEDEEFDLFWVPHLGEAVRRAGLNWFHLPIQDGDIPDARFDKLWPPAATVLTQTLSSGQKVVVHCRGGLGRTGLVSAMLLVELGEKPGEAMKRVRQSRPGAIETAGQEQYLMDYRPRIENPG